MKEQTKVQQEAKNNNVTAQFDTDNNPSMEKIKQNSSYREGNKCEPDNNIFFEERSNPLSSKGN